MRNYVINKEAVKAIQDYVSRSDKYRTKDILDSHNLLENLEEKGMGRLVISCPFHNDDKPSFNIREEDGAWRCFSCGRAGYALGLMYAINNELHKSSAGYYQFLNSLLASDLAMKTTVGFMSIYKEERDFMSSGPFVRKPFVPQQDREMVSYLQLSHYMRKNGLNSMEQIRLAVLFSQTGMNPNEILKHLKGIKDEVVETGTESFFDISGLLESGA